MTVFRWLNYIYYPMTVVREAPERSPRRGPRGADVPQLSILLLLLVVVVVLVVSLLVLLLVVVVSVVVSSLVLLL